MRRWRIFFWQVEDDLEESKIRRRRTLFMDWNFLDLCRRQGGVEWRVVLTLARINFLLHVPYTVVNDLVVHECRVFHVRGIKIW